MDFIYLFAKTISVKLSSSCLDFKNQGKKSAKTRKLGFLRKGCALGCSDFDFFSHFEV